MNSMQMQGPFFGVPLRVLCERDAVEVPIILGDLLRWLATRALSTPDAFAQPAKSCATSQLKIAIDSGVPVADLLEACHPAVSEVGSLLKLWLQDLPDPLLNWDEQVELLSACKDEGSIEQRVSALNDGLAMIDHYTLATLKPLLLFLQQYCFRQRRFDCQLLQVAVAMAPILFPAALSAGAPELRLAEETVATLVSNALHVFNPALAVNVPVVTPQALCEAAAEMQQQQQQQQDEEEQEQALQQCVAQHQAVQEQQERLQYTSHTFCADGSSSRAAVAVAAAAAADAAAAATLPSMDSDDYEPHLHDITFLASFDSMVSASVTDALFGDDDDDYHHFSDAAVAAGGAGLAAAAAGESAAAAWALVVAAEDDSCAASDVSSWSATQVLSSGGADSGGSSRAGSGGGEEQPQRVQPLVVPAPQGLGSIGGASVGALDLAPYSPGAVLVTPPPPPLAAADDAKARAAGGDSSSAAAAAVAAAAGVISAAVAAVAAKTSSASAAAAAVLAELARREIGTSNGSGAFCVISAQPATTTAANSPGAVLSATNTNKQGAAQQAPSSQLSKKQKQQPPVPQLSPLQIEMAEYLQEQEALIGGPAPPTPRRITEGGAGAVPPPSPSHGAAHGHGAHAHAGNATAARALSRLVVANIPTATIGDVVASRQRRMTMGGGSNGGAPTDAPRSPASSSGGGSAAASPRHHGSYQGHHAHPVHYMSVQIPRRQTMGGRRSSGGGSNSSGGGARRSSGGGSGSASPVGSTPATPLALLSPALTPTADPHAFNTTTTTTAIAAAGVVELGCAGHFAVALNTGDKTLAVRELRTPEAQAHRVPIRSLTPAQQQQEKERLKRQLKDVSHAFEALAGQPLTPALKEPLRPVYVRYHKIKALLALPAAPDGGKAAVGASPKLVLSTPPAAVVL